MSGGPSPEERAPIPKELELAPLQERSAGFVSQDLRPSLPRPLPCVSWPGSPSPMWKEGDEVEVTFLVSILFSVGST
jgi:hypothetical protein